MPNPDESERNAAARKLGRVGEKLLKNSSEIFKLIVASFEKFSHISGHEKALDIPGY
ncbi:hypothetical protein JHK82_017340 [Glycine max]|nr:hypothetical protein JHK82_017340 [Glycine max]